MSLSAIVLSGGRGKRMNNIVPKQYLLLGGKPVVLHSLEKLDRISSIKEIIIVCEDEYNRYFQDLIHQYRLTNHYKFAPAGKTRQESVYNGLELASYDNVLLHEAARPFITVEDLERLIAYPSLNAIYAIDIPYSVILGDSCVEGSIDRNTIKNVLLPQKFSKKMLFDAHNKAKDSNMQFTEDASLLHYYNKIKIDVLKGHSRNIKLTDQLDMIIAEIIYSELFARRL